MDYGDRGFGLHGFYFGGRLFARGFSFLGFDFGVNLQSFCRFRIDGRLLEMQCFGQVSNSGRG